MAKINIQELMAQTGVAFGTSGVRGLVSQMSGPLCAAYTLAFIGVLERPASGMKIAIGMDLRPSSPVIAAACAEAVRLAGWDVDFCGVLPTPALALYSLTQGMPAIMVTGSHIPFDRNGVKFYTAQGEINKAHELAITQAEVELLGFSDNNELPPVNGAAMQAYRQRYLSLFDGNFLSGWRIGVYEHSSAARDCLKALLADFGADVVSLDRTDTFVPIDTEAVSAEDRQRGLNWAAQYRLDAIISTDGDGDRPLIADETGNWLRGDIVGMLTAKFLGAAVVVTPVSCNTAIEASGWFAQTCRTRIGSPYVIAGMEAAAQTGGVAGFEANGGFLAGPGLVAGHKQLSALPTRDAVLPALSVLALARSQAGKISALLDQLPKRYTASNRIQDFPVENSRALLERLQSQASSAKAFWPEAMGDIVNQDTTDGLRITFANQEIIHLRPSGNAPELRCYAEAETMSRAEHLVAATLQKISGR